MAGIAATTLIKPVVTTLAFESLQRYLHAYVERKGRGDDARHEEIRQGMSAMLQYAEQEVLRELNAGLAALEDALETENERTRESRLAFAETELLRCTHLDPKLSTGGERNSYLMAVAHHRLSLVSTLRGDRVIAAKHLLKCFREDPRAARLELAPDLFLELFAPRCQDILQYRDQEQQKVAKKYASKWLTFQASMLKGASGAGKGMAKMVGEQGAMGRYVGSWTSQLDAQATQAEKDARASKHVAERVAGKMTDVERVVEKRLDARCREIALDLLKGGSPGITGQFGPTSSRPMILENHFEGLPAPLTAPALPSITDGRSDSVPPVDRRLGQDQSATHRQQLYPSITQPP